MWIRMAEIEPPKMAPQYMAPSTMRPVSAFMVKVIGSISATPIAADKPGRQPIMIPIAVPAIIIRRLIGMKAFKKPAPMILIVSSISIVPLRTGFLLAA